MCHRSMASWVAAGSQLGEPGQLGRVRRRQTLVVKRLRLLVEPRARAVASIVQPRLWEGLGRTNSRVQRKASKTAVSCRCSPALRVGSQSAPGGLCRSHGRHLQALTPRALRSRRCACVHRGRGQGKLTVHAVRRVLDEERAWTTLVSSRPKSILESLAISYVALLCRSRAPSSGPSAP